MDAIKPCYRKKYKHLKKLSLHLEKHEASEETLLLAIKDLRSKCKLE